MRPRECIESFRLIASRKGWSHEAPFNSSFGNTDICWSFDVQQSHWDVKGGLYFLGVWTQWACRRYDAVNFNLYHILKRGSADVIPRHNARGTITNKLDCVIAGSVGLWDCGGGGWRSSFRLQVPPLSNKLVPCVLPFPHGLGRIQTNVHGNLPPRVAGIGAVFVVWVARVIQMRILPHFFADSLFQLIHLQ